MRLTAAIRRNYALSTALVLSAFIAACSGSSEPDVEVASVTVSPAAESREIGQTVQLSATVKDAAGNIISGQSVTWSSSASTVASVSSSGLVTAHALGVATITAASGSKSGVATINVIPPPVASITLAPTNDTLLVGETVQLATTLRDASNNIVTGRTVTWLSSSATVATVSSSGLVTGVGDGTATITASVDGRSASATIRVLSPCSTALAGTIAVGQTINGTLSSTDCKLDDDTYADGYGITVTAVTNVQIDMTATYDTYLVLFELLNGQLIQRAFNDDVDPDDENDPNDPVNTNSRILFALQPNAQYFVLANSFDANVFGPYQLKVVATTFIAGSALAGKPGKAPISILMRALKPPK
jgi:Tfp pilus assembly protein PilZ